MIAPPLGLPRALRAESKQKGFPRRIAGRMAWSSRRLLLRRPCPLRT